MTDKPDEASQYVGKAARRSHEMRQKTSNKASPCISEDGIRRRLGRWPSREDGEAWRQRQRRNDPGGHPFAEEGRAAQVSIIIDIKLAERVKARLDELDELAVDAITSGNLGVNISAGSATAKRSPRCAR
jgi:hypothetical protein